MKFAWFRPLEPVDGLFGVADRKHGPDRLTRCAQAGKKFLGQRFDHAPLDLVGVLGLVDQNMVNPAVQFIENPGRYPLARQKVSGFQDQVVIIQIAKPGFFLLV